jgi:alpha-beta hydrolase superfamily lysophospholipase
VGAVQRYEDTEPGTKLGLPIYEWKDNDVCQRGLIVAITGMTFYGPAFDSFSMHSAAEGFPVYTCDLRGFGRWQQAAEKYPNDRKVHYDQSVADLHNLIAYLHETNPNQKIFCVGESIGANLAIRLAAENANVDGIILVGLSVKQEWHPQPRWVTDFFKGILYPSKPFDLEPYTRRYMTEDPQIAERYLNDPNIYRQLTWPDLIKAVITNQRAIKMASNMPPQMPILILSGGQDKIFKPKYLREFAAKVGANRTSIKILPNRGHLLMELQPLDPEVASAVDTWLTNQTSTTIVHAVRE